MKHLITTFIICLCIIACKKEVARTSGKEAYLENVKSALEDSMGITMANSLDFSKVILSEVDSINLHFLNIPLRDSHTGSFVLVQTDKWGTILKGRLVALKRESAGATTATNPPGYHGNITIRTLKGELLVESAIVEGSILAFHQRNSGNRQGQLSQAQLVQPDNTMLPEVIVIGYRESGGGISYSDWMSLQSMFGSGGGGSAGYYSPVSGSDGGSSGYGAGGGGGGGSVTQVPPISIDFEGQVNNPAIDIEAYFKCFATIPDVGAVCSIEILTDIPVDKDPNKLFNWETESPGHTFLQIKKSNGGQTVMQNIGFYPRTNWKTILTPAPVNGKFVDNGGHEFNASFLMNITPAQLQSALAHIAYLSKFIKYDIDEYNCTDFALEVFNYACNPSKQLEIPKYDIPGGMAPYGTSTPQGLYNKLKTMKEGGNAGASNISMPGYKGWVAGSHGACN